MAQEMRKRKLFRIFSSFLHLTTRCINWKSFFCVKMRTRKNGAIAGVKKGAISWDSLFLVTFDSTKAKKKEWKIVKELENYFDSFCSWKCVLWKYGIKKVENEWSEWNTTFGVIIAIPVTPANELKCSNILKMVANMDRLVFLLPVTLFIPSRKDE